MKCTGICLEIIKYGSRYRDIDEIGLSIIEAVWVMGTWGDHHVFYLLLCMFENFHK